MSKATVFSCWHMLQSILSVADSGELKVRHINMVDGVVAYGGPKKKSAYIYVCMYIYMLTTVEICKYHKGLCQEP